MFAVRFQSDWPGDKAPGGSVHYLMVPHQDGKVDKFCAFFGRLVVGNIHVGRIAILKSIPWPGGIRGREH